MQVFKLVNAGFADRVIAFDVLPESLVKGVRTREPAGFPRAWSRWMGSVGSVRDVMKTETSVDLARNWTFKHTPIGKEACFYVLEYTDINADKEYWRRICEYLKQNCGEGVRLKEKIEDMARPLATTHTDPLELEPEDVPVVVVPNVEEKKSDQDIIKEGETVLVEPNSDVPPAEAVEAPKKRRGRPRKVPVEA